MCQHQRWSPSPGPGPGHSLSQRAAPPSDTARKQQRGLGFTSLLNKHGNTVTVTVEVRTKLSYVASMNRCSFGLFVPVYGDQVYRFLTEPSPRFRLLHRLGYGTGQTSGTTSDYRKIKISISSRLLEAHVYPHS